MVGNTEHIGTRKEIEVKEEKDGVGRDPEHQSCEVSKKKRE